MQSPLDVELAFSAAVRIDRERVWLNDGVEFVTEEGAKSSHYYVGAPVPLEQWRSAPIVPATCSLSGPAFLHTVCIDRLGDEGEALRRELVGKLGSADDPQAAAIKERLERHLASRYRVAERGFSSIGIVGKSPGMRTVTMEVKTGKLPGLHIDRWSTTDSDEHMKSTIRINVNLGPQPRFFLFCRAHISRINRANAAAYPGTLDSTYYDYLMDHTNTSVYKVLILPGELYIAPTDCIIHDASTLVCTETVFTLQIRGHVSATLPIAALCPLAS